MLHAGTTQLAIECAKTFSSSAAISIDEWKSLWCSMLDDLIILVDSLNIRLGMGCHHP